MKYDQQESQRLSFRKFEPSDIDTWAEFFIDNPYLPYLGLENQADKKAMASQWINLQLNRYLNDQWGHLAMIAKTTGELIGSCGIIPRCLNGQAIHEIAYAFKPQYWGQGYATEATRTLKDFGFQHQIADSLLSIIHQDNHNSKKVARKNGMTKIETTTFWEMPVDIFAISRAAWQTQKLG